MTFLLYTAITFVSLVIYIALGVLISATVFKRRNASWTWWGSNIVEFFFAVESSGIISLIFYLAVWPFWIAFELSDRLWKYIKKKWLSYRSPPRMTGAGPTFFYDFQSNSLYPSMPPFHLPPLSSKDRTMSNEIKKTITDTVNAYPGIKATELVAKVLDTLYSKVKTGEDDSVSKGTTSDMLDALDAMVSNGELTEVEYILPTMDYRIKSLYFPKGTKVQFPQASAAEVG